MSSSDSSQGQKHNGISGGALAAAIALPIIFGVALLLAIPFIIARYRRKIRKVELAERGFGHQRTMSDISETDKPLLLMESPPRSSFARPRSLSPLPGEMTYEFTEAPSSSHLQLPSISLNSGPPTSHEKLADLAYMPMPSLTPPAATNKPLPILLSTPKLPERPVSAVSKPRDLTTTTDLLHRPSFLTKPRPAPPIPGALKAGRSRRGRPDMRGALLTRMATKRSRSQGDPTEEDSPVSIYSQASLRRGDTHKWFPKGGVIADSDAPPVPSLPQPFSDELDSPTDRSRSYSLSGVPSPSRDIFQSYPGQGPEADLSSPSYILRDRLFNDDTALPSPEASLVSNGRWWSNVWGSYIPSSPTNPSPTQTTTGGLGFPVGRRTLGNRQSVQPTTKDVAWHAMPEYGVVDRDYGNVDAERGQVMVAAWSLGDGAQAQGRVEREARRLPPAPSPEL